jgi:Double zinc ribbon
MPDCPRCRQPVDTKAIACPYCRTTLKAHGHPGIPLYRSPGIEPLCKTCVYDADDSCTFPKRPDARECTLYQDVAAPISSRYPRGVVQPAKYGGEFLSKAWFRRNFVWIALIGLVILSVVITLAG